MPSAYPTHPPLPPAPHPPVYAANPTAPNTTAQGMLMLTASSWVPGFTPGDDQVGLQAHCKRAYGH